MTGFMTLRVTSAAAASASNNVGLLVFTGDLRSALFRVVTVRDPCPFSQQIVPERFSLSLIELEDRSVNSTLRVLIFQSHRVVFLVGKETDGTAAAERDRRFSKSHRQAANLLALVADRNVLNRFNSYLRYRFSDLLKLKCVACDCESAG